MEITTHTEHALTEPSGECAGAVQMQLDHEAMAWRSAIELMHLIGAQMSELAEARDALRGAGMAELAAVADGAQPALLNAATECTKVLMLLQGTAKGSS